jgi:DNA-binding transcriptional LysR family regulator
LVNESWVLPPPESVISSIAMQAFAAGGLDYPSAAVVTLTPEVRMTLVATGRFITIFPASMVRFSARRSEIKVLPVHLGTARVPTGIVTLQNRSLSPVANLFIASCRDLAKTMTKYGR